MIAPLYPVLSCCGARATPSNIVGHKCKAEPSSRAKAVKSLPAGVGDGREYQTGGGSAPSRAGKAAEDALCAALVAAGYEVIDFRTWLWRALDGTPFTGFVREFNVGALLAEPRRFRCDLLHASTRTAIEVEGDAHAVKRQRRGDILREQLLTSAGLRVVRVLPEQCGEQAVEIVKRAIGAREDDA